MFEPILIITTISACLAFITGFIIFLGTKHKTKWGINLKPVICPECNKELSRLRAPKNTQSALWGGHSCEACKLKLDKWGRLVK